MGLDVAFCLYKSKESYSVPAEPILNFMRAFGATNFEFSSEDSVMYPEIRGDRLFMTECWVHLDKGRISGVSMERPGGPDFEEFAFGLMDRFGFWLLAGGIDTIYHVHGDETDLPDVVYANADCKPERISKPGDIWPRA